MTNKSTITIVGFGDKTAYRQKEAQSQSDVRVDADWVTVELSSEVRASLVEKALARVTIGHQLVKKSSDSKARRFGAIVEDAFNRAIELEQTF
jgi:hypothetical protein